MRLRLFLSFAFIVLITIASVIFLAARQAAMEVRAFAFRQGMGRNEGLTTFLENYYRRNGSWRDLEADLGDRLIGAGESRGPFVPFGRQRLRLADTDGNVILDTLNRGTNAYLTSSEMSAAIPLTVNNQVVGYLLAEGGVPIPPNIERDLVQRLNRAALVASVFAGALSLLLAFLLAYVLLRPVRELTRAAAALARGNLSYRVDERGDDELAVLASTFNQMADSLQQAESRRKALTADIAHELRTPLAVQRANLEALEDGIYPPSPENLQSILEQNQLLSRLVEDLRTLALADADRLSLDRTPTAMVPFIHRAVERFRPQADSQSIGFYLQLDESCPDLSLDPGRLEQILNNLLTNALRHTPEGGAITIALDCTGEDARLTIRDTGPGFPEETLPHIFERFYRADRSRSRSEGGTGLGLAIARHLARAHGGSLTADNPPSGGARFTLTFPFTSPLP